VEKSAKHVLKAGSLEQIVSEGFLYDTVVKVHASLTKHELIIAHEDGPEEKVHFGVI
jgi:hypothetical protein